VFLPEQTTLDETICQTAEQHRSAAEFQK